MRFVADRNRDGGSLLPSDYASPGFRLFGQPTARWVRPITPPSGPSEWHLDCPASGVTLFGLARLPVSLSLPGGFSVELARELVPPANRIDHEGLAGPRRFFLDVCVVLRVRRGGTIVAEARRQHEIVVDLHGNPGGSTSDSATASGELLSIEAGYYVTAAGSLALYANAFDLPSSETFLSGGAIGRWVSPELYPDIPDTRIYGSRLAGPFGRGMTLEADASDVTEPVGAITATSEASNAGTGSQGDLAEAWFGHTWPLDERLPLAPISTPITARQADRVAWGRQPALVAAAPSGWALTPLETDGHPEWRYVLTNLNAFRPYYYHPGASRLHDGGVLRALVPAAAHRSNISSEPAANDRLASLEASWTDNDGWASGVRSLPNLFGAWNEYRMPTWHYTSGSASTATSEAVFLAANLQRVDATNLGSAATQAEAVEVSRVILRFAALAKFVGPDPFGTTRTTYTTRLWQAVLAPAHAAALLAGDTVTISSPYSQGTYPAATTAGGLFGVLTLRAAG